MDHQNKNKNGDTPTHIPVLLDEVLQYLAPQKGETYLDATAGYGGHAAAILGKTDQDKGSVLVDRDQTAATALGQRFEGRDVEIMHSDFASAAEALNDQGRQFDLILADLGVSSEHLDNASRGFSLKQAGPLDMRMDQAQELRAETIVNNWKKEELVKLLKQYGEEYRAERIVSAIIAARPIQTTEQLATIVAGSVGGRSKVHPATKTFQALRIAVNRELDQLQITLPLWIRLLKPSGRIGIITFHSLEDRIVKDFFKEHSASGYEASLELVTKKPISASQQEIVFNPRSRSAKLRVAAKIKNQKGATNYAYQGTQ